MASQLWDLVLPEPGPVEQAGWEARERRSIELQEEVLHKDPAGHSRALDSGADCASLSPYRVFLHAPDSTC